MVRLNFRLAWNIVAAVIIVAAVVVSGLRAIMPRLDRDRALVAEWVSHLVGASLEIGALETSLERGMPTVRAHAIQILSSDAMRSEVLRFEHAQAHIGLWASLREGRPALRDITLSGLALTVVRQQTGKWAVKGFANSDTKFLDWLVTQQNLLITDADLVFVDETLSLPPIRAVSVSLRFDARDNRISIRGRATHVDLVAAGVDFEMQLTRHNMSRALDVRLVGEQLDLVTLAERLQLKRPDVASFRADAELRYLATSPRRARLLFGFDNIDMEAKHSRFAPLGLHGQAVIEPTAMSVAITRIDTHENPGSAVDWRAVIERQESLNVRLTADRMPLGTLSWASAWLPPTFATLSESLANYRPVGEIRDLRLGSTAQQTYVAGSVRNFDLRPANSRFRLKDFAAHFAGNRQGGTLALNNANATIQDPVTLVSPLKISALNGVAQWTSNPGVEVIAKTTLSGFANDLPVSLDAVTRLTDGHSSIARLSAFVGTGDITKFAQLVPTTLMHPRGDHWLRAAFRDGVLEGASFTVDEAPDSKMAQDGDQPLRVTLSVDNVHLHYAAGWPDATGLSGSAEITNGRLDGTLTAASFLTSPLIGASFSVPEVFAKKPVLAVTGIVRASLDDALTTLRESPLKSNAATQLATLEVDGQFDLALDLRLGLYPHATRTTLGSVTFDGNRVRSKPYQVELEDLRGRVSFTHDDWYGEDLTATLAGQRIGIVATGGVGDPNYDTEFRVTGTTRADEVKKVIARFVPAVHQWLEAHGKLPGITGSTPWKAVLTFPRADDTAPTSNLVLESSLAGLGIALPWPFGKAEAEHSILKIQMPLGNNGQQTAQIDFGDNVQLALRYEAAVSGPRMTQVDAAFGTSAGAVFDHPGIYLHGKVETLVLNEWASLFRTDAPSANELAIGFDLEVAKLTTRGQVLEDVQLAGAKDNLRWQVKLNSDHVAGEITLPRRNTSAPVTVNFERLWLKRATPSGRDQPSTFNPRDLPPLEVTCASCKYGEIDLGQATLATTRVTNGMRIDSLRFQNPAFVLQATGEWVGNDNDQHSQFSIALQGDELGPLLQRFGYNAKAINEGKTKINLEATWPGTPADFTLDQLDGKLNLRVGKGRFLDIEPGSGRLFGLLSLQTLPRRLSLDFADLFKKGFVFDRIEGWFELEAGNAYTNSLLMEGPSAKVEITGRTGLALKDYDQRAIVTPALSKSIPLASALFGPAGIGVGAAIYLGQKVFKDLPDQVDKFLQKRYSITGTWDSPKVERL